MTDLIERLRTEVSPKGLRDRQEYLIEESADEIDRLRARLNRAEELLRQAANVLPRQGQHDIIPGGGMASQCRVGDLIDGYLGERND